MRAGDGRNEGAELEVAPLRCCRVAFPWAERRADASERSRGRGGCQAGLDVDEYLELFCEGRRPRRRPRRPHTRLQFDHDITYQRTITPTISYTVNYTHTHLTMDFSSGDPKTQIMRQVQQEAAMQNARMLVEVTIPHLSLHPLHYPY